MTRSDDNETRPPDADLRFVVRALDGQMLDTFTLGEVGSWRAAGCWAALAAIQHRNARAEREETV